MIISVIDQTLLRAGEILAKWMFGVCLTKSKPVNVLKRNNKKAIPVPHTKMITIKRKAHFSFSLLLMIYSSQIFIHAASILRNLMGFTKDTVAVWTRNTNGSFRAAVRVSDTRIKVAQFSGTLSATKS